MNRSGFFSVCFLVLFLAGNQIVICRAETPFTEAEIWKTAVAWRTRSFTYAPGELSYEQYSLDKNGNTEHTESGRLGLAYGEDGKVIVSVLWVRRDGIDFTAERVSRLEKQAPKRNELLTFFTPFDIDIQDKVERKTGKQILAEGKVLWEYEFRLPADKTRSFTGTARVCEDGRPYDYNFAVSPMPRFADFMNIHISFNTIREYLVFDSIDYNYKASFLFWVWTGGGNALLSNWKWISSPPRLN